MKATSSLTCLLVLSLAVTPAPSRSEPVTAAIAVGSLVVSAIGGLFGRKAARAGARARAKQYEAMMKEIKAVDANVAANRALLIDIVGRIGNLTEDGERLRLHTDATSAALSLYRTIEALEEAAFVTEEDEQRGIVNSLSRSISELERANDFYKGRLIQGNDLTLVPHFAANVDALITAMHLQSLLSTKSTDERRLLEAGFDRGVGFLCEEEEEIWGEILGDSANIDCEGLGYTEVQQPFTRARLQNMVEDALETLNKVIDRNISPTSSEFEYQEAFLASFCESTTVNLVDVEGEYSVLVKEYSMPTYLQIRHRGDSASVEELAVDIGIFDSFSVPFGPGPFDYDVIFLEYGTLQVTWATEDETTLNTLALHARFQPDFEVDSDGDLRVNDTKDFPYPESTNCEQIGETHNFHSRVISIQSSLSTTQLDLDHDQIVQFEDDAYFDTAEGNALVSKVLSRLVNPDSNDQIDREFVFELAIEDSLFSDIADPLVRAGLGLRSSGVAAAILARDLTSSRAIDLGLSVGEEG